MGEKRKRKLVIVEGRDLNIPMTNEVIEAAISMGWDAENIKTPPTENIVNNTLDEVFSSDYVLWRGTNGSKSAFEVERAFYWVKNNCRAAINVNPAGGRFSTSDKFFQHQCFLADEVVAEHTLPMYQALSKENVLKMVADGTIKYPFLLKQEFGTRGLNIFLVESEADLDKFNDNYVGYSIEPYVKSKYDWRVFVLGGSALGAMRKVGDENNERNFEAKSGGRVRWNETDPDICEELYDIAVRASATSGLEYTGVDFIRDDETGKFYILETNIAAGWQNGFLNATGISIPRKIVQWFNERARLIEGVNSVSKCVSDYVKNRRKFMSRAGLKRFDEIVAFEKKIEGDRDELNAKVETSETPLVERLSSAYALISNYDELTEIEKVKLKMFISDVEKYEISHYGNFIGKDSGSLEQSLDATAYYLAISSKL